MTCLILGASLGDGGVVACNFGVATGFGYEAAEYAHSGGFACSIGSPKTANFPLINMQNQLVHCREVAEFAGEVFGIYHLGSPNVG